MSSPLTETVQPSHTAVLIIDMQNDYVHRNGASLRYFRERKDGREMARAKEPSAAEQMVPCLLGFVAAARQAGARIIWVRTINDEFTASPTAVAQNKRFAWAGDEWGTAFYQSLSPQAGEPVITKHRHSAFFGTDLEIVLGRLDIKTVILTGVSTPYCVESTGRDAFARDYRVITLADCTASKVQTEHEAALLRLGRVFGKVMMAGEVTAVWQTK